MHELSITEAMLDIVMAHASGRRVVDVHVTVGELSSYVDESISMYWTELSRGTLAEGARLHFTKETATLRCLDCQMEFPMSAADFICPHCGSLHALPHGGRECRVESIEVEEPS